MGAGAVSRLLPHTEVRDGIKTHALQLSKSSRKSPEGIPERVEAPRSEIFTDYIEERGEDAEAGSR